MAAVWEDYRATTDEIVDLGQHVLTVRHITARGAIGGVPVDFQIFALVRFDCEVAVSAKSFRTRQEALEAADLQE